MSSTAAMTPVQHRVTNGPTLDSSYMTSFPAREASSSAPPSASFAAGTRSSLGPAFAWNDHETPKHDHYYRDVHHWESSHSFDSDDVNMDSPSTRRAGSSTARPRPNMGDTETPDRRSEGRPKRPARAQQACDNCRIKKSKCDEKTPRCTGCWEAGIECKYKSTKSGKKDPKFENLHDKIQALHQEVDSVKVMIQYVINDLESQHRSVDYNHLDLDNHAHPFVSQAQASFGSPLPETVMMEPLHHQDGLNQSYQAHNRVYPNILQGPLSIPFQHSTPAHKLVEYWKCVRPFYRGISPTNYVMQTEWNREPLSVSSLSSALEKTTLPMTRKASFQTRLSFDQENYAPHTIPDGSLRFESRAHIQDSRVLEVESRAAQTLWESFLRHIHILHPFVNTHRIGSFVKNMNHFVMAKGSPSQPNRSFGSHGLAVKSLFNGGSMVAGEKRKRGDESAGNAHVEGFGHMRTARFHTESAIDTAIILLVFALGDICRSENLFDGSRSYGVSSASLSDEESLLMPEITFAAPPIRWSTLKNAGLFVNKSMQDELCHHSQISTSETPEGYVSVDNVSVGIPGLAYYIAATRILGELTGSTALNYVHAMLLAGLYASQLLRPKESFSWINSAGRAMLIILQANPDSMSPENQDIEADAIRIPYWTCLQLESDLLAELDFPPSGISRYEDQVAVPGCNINGPNDPGDPAFDMYSIMASFAQQIYLRKVLNRTHTALYNTEGKLSRQQGWSALSARELAEFLETWKESLRVQNSGRLSWEESELAATHINAARMRAKYYGAKVIINRPFLQQALNENERALQSQSSSFMSDATTLSATDPTNVGPFSAINSDTLVGAQNCVAALIKSTEAFDRLPTMPNRLIVTNLFGTAQAQFGNILVLAAVVRSGFLSSLITTSDFDRLLKRTINLIKRLAPMSETFQKHLRVLRNIEEDITQRNGM